jgi:hypothetical protein
MLASAPKKPNIPKEEIKEVKLLPPEMNFEGIIKFEFNQPLIVPPFIFGRRLEVASLSSVNV